MMNFRTNKSWASVFVLGSLAWCCLSTSGQETSFLTNGLAAYFPFDGNAKDASGFGHDGTVHGAVLAEDRFGTPNRAYFFDGTGADVIAVPFSSELFAGDFTASIWFKAYEHADGFPQLLHEQSQTFILQMPIENSNTNGPASVQTWGNSAEGGLVWQLGWRVPLNRYVHALITKTGEVASLYINGQFVMASPLNGLTPTKGKTLYIGRADFESDTVSFHGVIDDIRIYNRALSLSEVSQLYTYESAPQSRVPHRATATATVVNGFVVGINILDGGFGYTDAPLVKIISGTGTGATVTATVKDGVVTSIAIADTGSGYTGTTSVSIASPPFTPWLDMSVSKVKVTQHVVLGKNYVLESCTDLRSWIQVGTQFTAQDETLTQEFDCDVTGRYFRIRQVP